VGIDDGGDGEWEFEAAIINACKVESLFVTEEENTEKNHWILVLDATGDTEEGKNLTTMDTENEHKQGEAYTPPTTKLPMSFMVARLIGNHTSMRLLRVLFDSGGSCTWINSRALPRGCTPMLLDQPTSSLTLAGTLELNRCVIINGITLPEFDRNKKIEKQGAFVFDGPCNYDVILGRDFLETVGLTLNFDSQQIKWMNREIEMKTEILVSMAEKLAQEMNNEDLENYVGQILESKYDKVSPAEVAAAQKHLITEQRKSIEILVTKYPRLFSGELGVYPGRKIHLEVEPGAIPVHARPYSVARLHLEVFKQELKRLVEIGVLRPCGATNWASPTFVIPKKDQQVRWVSDFRELNKVLRRRVYPLPRIQEILQRRSGYQFFSKLDISMMFYAFELDEPSRELCTIVTPFGKFQYCRLPMGVKVAPDIAQETIEAVLGDIDCEKFIDDVGCFSNNWTDHVQLLDTILSRLDIAGFTINPLKCEWGVKETDFLGYWLTPVGLKPWQKR
jgi:Reverse transcriptase (RNA-dependent DNA polymerase)